jgi:hypothetical protein
LELTHDLLAGVVRASRESRRERDTAEREKAASLRAQEEEKQALLKTAEEKRLALEKAQEAERQERDRRELKRFRFAAVVFATLALVAGSMAFWAWRAQHQADTDRLAAEAAKEKAQQAVDQLLTQLRTTDLRGEVLQVAGTPTTGGGTQNERSAPAPETPRAKRLGNSRNGDAGREKPPATNSDYGLAPAPPPPPPTTTPDSANAAGTSQASATLPRVFVQIVNKNDATYAKGLSANLTGIGCSVQPTQYVPQAAILSRTDVRYYRQSDQKWAQKILDTVKAAGQSSARMYIPSGQENNPNVRPNTFEVWLANGVGGQPSQGAGD